MMEKLIIIKFIASLNYLNKRASALIHEVISISSYMRWQRIMTMMKNTCEWVKILNNFLSSLFHFFKDLSTLVYQLDILNYSTLIYVLNSGSIDETISQEQSNHMSFTSQQTVNDLTGYCDVIASEFSAIYKKNFIIWPCPGMKVSETNVA